MFTSIDSKRKREQQNNDFIFCRFPCMMKKIKKRGGREKDSNSKDMVVLGRRDTRVRWRRLINVQYQIVTTGDDGQFLQISCSLRHSIGCSLCQRVIRFVGRLNERLNGGWSDRGCIIDDHIFEIGQGIISLFTSETKEDLKKKRRRRHDHRRPSNERRIYMFECRLRKGIIDDIH